MPDSTVLQELAPVVLTAALFVVVVVVAYREASRQWADLAGLLYLVASPLVYRATDALVTAAAPSADGSTTAG